MADINDPLFLLYHITAPYPQETFQESSFLLAEFFILKDVLPGTTTTESAHGIFQARVLEWGAIAFSSLSL